MSDSSRLRNVLVMGASMVALTAFTAPALAQTAPPVTPEAPAAPPSSQAGQSAADVGTVIVTAERRAQNVQGCRSP